MSPDLLVLFPLFAEYYENLKQGDFWAALAGPYIDIFPGGVFYAIILMLAVGMVYLKSQSFGLAMFVMVLGSAVLASVFPAPVHQLFMVFTAIGITVIFYRLFTRRGVE